MDDLRRQYSLDPGITYFNHGSIGTVPRPVQEAHRRYLDQCESNPWLYMWGGGWEEEREAVRAAGGRCLGSPAADVALAHNTTETFNVLAQGLPLGPGDEVLFSSLNHSGASACWHHQAAVRGFSVRRFDFPLERVPELTADEIVDLHDRAIGEATRVLVFPHLDNLVGLRHPMAELTAAARSRGVEWVAVDGAQAVGMIPAEAAAAGVDLYATSPHKWLQAPKGLGLAYLAPRLRAELRPMWVTWGQDRWQGSVRIFEDYGSRDMPGLMALGDAIAFQEGLGAELKERRYRALRRVFRASVAERPHLVWRSPESWELGASLFTVEVPGHESGRLHEKLYGEHRFVFRPFATRELDGLRLSPNLANDEGEVERFFATLDAIVG